MPSRQQDTGKYRKNRLDKFYTQPSIAVKCVDAVMDQVIQFVNGIPYIRNLEASLTHTQPYPTAPLVCQPALPTEQENTLESQKELTSVPSSPIQL
jgi:hypothetical protein